MSDWTATRIHRVRQLAALGLPASEIGKTLGVTRNAIIGKCGREGISLARIPRSDDNKPRATPPDYLWTPTVIHETLRMWRAGVPVSEIARTIGTTVAAVGNKARGSKWGKHPTTLAREEAARLRGEGRRPEARSAAPTPVLEHDGVAFEDLRGGCAYALNDAPRHDLSGLRFCGQPRREGSSYCPHCHSLSWVPAPQRAHRRAA
jgi:hypothetical protein